VMGILNVTDDSFSGDGVGVDVGKAVERALQMEKDGADIVDIGGESTRRYSKYHADASAPKSAEFELQRVLPVIAALKQELSIPISIDTYKASVARAAVAAGASMINDVWGGQKDSEMFAVARETGVPIILMHNSEEGVESEVCDEVVAYLRMISDEALEKGVRFEQIIIDPGIGFAKTTEQSRLLLKHLDALHVFGYPILLGVSRKSVIGQTLDVPVEERLAGSLAANVFGLLNGASILRVHDVRETVQAVRMVEAVLGEKEC